MVDNDKSKKLGLADLVGISKLLDTLVEQGNLTSVERDKVAWNASSILYNLFWIV